MARTARNSIAGQPHHVIQRGNNRSTIFGVENDYEFFAESLRRAIRLFDCQIHAYVFMTNHVHLLMTPADATAIGRAMRSLGSRYVKYFNRSHDRTGTLFEGRYRATVVDTERYLFTCYRYIEENPVRAGLARDPSIYRWSSYRANALGSQDSLITPHERFLTLGRTPEQRRSAYKELFQHDLDSEALMTIRSSIVSGVSLSEVSTSMPQRAHDLRPSFVPKSPSLTARQA